MYKLPPEYRQKLEDAGIEYQITSVHGPQFDGPTLRARIFDKITGKVMVTHYHNGSGADVEPIAAMAAIDKAMIADRPLTAAQTAAHALALEKENAELKGLLEGRGGTMPSEPDKEEEAVVEPEPEHVVEEKGTPGSQREEGRHSSIVESVALKADRVLKELESRRIPIPKGRKDTTKWIQQAQGLIDMRNTGLNNEDDDDRGEVRVTQFSKSATGALIKS